MTPEDRERLEELANEMPEPGCAGLEALWRHALYDRSPYEVAETVRVNVHDMHVGMAIRSALEELDDTEKERELLACLLRRTCDALKGPPDPPALHSWHDLPEEAERLTAENAKLRKVAEAARATLTEGDTPGFKSRSWAQVRLEEALREAGVMG